MSQRSHQVIRLKFRPCSLGDKALELHWLLIRIGWNESSMWRAVVRQVFKRDGQTFLYLFDETRTSPG